MSLYYSEHNRPPCTGIMKTLISLRQCLIKSTPFRFKFEPPSQSHIILWMDKQSLDKSKQLRKIHIYQYDYMIINTGKKKRCVKIKGHNRKTKLLSSFSFLFFFVPYARAIICVRNPTPCSYKCMLSGGPFYI